MKCKKWIDQTWLHDHGTTKKSEFPTRMEPMTTRTPGGRSIWAQYENSWRSRSFNWVFMWQASGILLGTALSKSLWVVQWIKMVNFKLGNEIWKVNWATWHELGKKKKSESPIWEGRLSTAFDRPSHLPCTLTSKTCLQLRYNILKGRTFELMLLVPRISRSSSSSGNSWKRKCLEE